MKKWLAVTVVLAVVGVAGYVAWTLFGRDAQAGRYSLAEVTRGNLENTITSTGTLKPVGTVEVGTQVSGTIAEKFVDFNDHVEAGQLLAVVDATLLKASVLEAEAKVERAQAQLEQDRADYERNIALHAQGLIADEVLLASKVKVEMQQATIKSEQATLDRAEANLKYAFIRSPIAGTVIERNVEVGQTVAASFSTPTLFVIAADLADMEIHALVDESDIGQIREAQIVRFTVQAYPDETFTGTVTKVRLQPTVEQNVVNYTVVISAPNPKGILLPGMTATVDFVVEERKDVLLVPNTALRLQPQPEMIESVRKSRGKGDRKVPEGGGPSEGERPQDVKLLWYLDSDSSLAVDRVKTGATDGRMTEILSTQNLQEGMRVIAGFESRDNSAQQSQNSMRGARRGFF